MPATTTYYARNIIRRALRELVDPSPSKREITSIWEFFESSCAYCGAHLSRENKKGHIDHLVAASLGGTNHISNRVLSCATCNEKEKLDQPWEQFIRHKNSDEKVLSQRQAKIVEWASRSERRSKDDLLEAADKAAARVYICFDEEVAKLRQTTPDKSLTQEQVDPLPEEFDSYEAAAQFWDTHDTTDYLDNFETVTMESGVTYSISPAVTNEELNGLFAVSWRGHEWRDLGSVLGRSLAYVCAYERERLVGFVNLAWDGDCHAFVLDTTVHPELRRRGVGLELVRRALAEAEKRGVEWVHVDFEPHLQKFYERCGFADTAAGLLHLGR